MRFVACLLMTLSILAWTPNLSLAEEELAAASEAELAEGDAATPSVDPTASSLTMQEVVVGTAVLGGVFAVGLLAGGSLSTGIAAASAVVLVYSFMP
jgi:hypothetical protein